MALVAAESCTKVYPAKRQRVAKSEPLIRAILGMIEAASESDEWKSELRARLASLDSGVDAVLQNRTKVRSTALRPGIVRRIARLFIPDGRPFVSDVSKRYPTLPSTERVTIGKKCWCLECVLYNGHSVPTKINSSCCK